MKRIAVIISVGLIVVGCSSGSESSDSTVVPGGASTTVVDTTVAASNGSASDGSGTASCVGVWELDNEAFFVEYDTIAGAGEAIEFVSGAYLVTWNADGTFTDQRVDWTMSFPEMPETGMMVMNSLGAGVWEALSTSIVSSGYEITDAQLQIVSDGVAVDLPVEPGALPAGVFPEEASVSCTETTMTISAGGFESILHRQHG